MLDLDSLKSSPGYYYVMSPYSRHPAGLEIAFQQACEATGWLMERGVKAFSPIAHSHALSLQAGIDPLSHAFWMPVDRPLMEAAVGGIVAQLPGWNESFGVAAELAYFREAGKPVHLLPWPIHL